MAVVTTKQVPNQASGHKPKESVYLRGHGAKTKTTGGKHNRKTVTVSQDPVLTEFLAENPWYVLNKTNRHSRKGGSPGYGYEMKLNPDYFDDKAIQQADRNFRQGVSGGVQSNSGGTQVVGGPAAESGNQRTMNFSDGIQNSQGRKGRRRSLLAGGYDGVSEPAFIGQSLLGG